MNSLNSIIFAKEEEEDAEDIKQDYHYKFKNQLNWNVAYLSLFETYFEDENLNDLVISNYSGLIVTSKRAALALKSVKFEDIPVYCVGYSTSKQMNKLGYKTFGMESGNSLNLGYFIIKNHSIVDNLPLLFVCGDKSMPTIPKFLNENDIKFECLKVYKTCKKSFLFEETKDLFDKFNNNCYLVVFSPSGFDLLIEITNLLGISNLIKWISIGETTSNRISKEVELFLQSKPNSKILYDDVIQKICDDDNDFNDVNDNI